MKQILLTTFLFFLVTALSIAQIDCQLSSCDPQIEVITEYTPAILEEGESSEIKILWNLDENDSDIGCSGVSANTWKIQIALPNTYEYNNDVDAPDFNFSYSALDAIELHNKEMLAGSSGEISFSVTAKVNTENIADNSVVQVMIHPIFLPNACPGFFGNAVDNDVIVNGIEIENNILPIELLHFTAQAIGYDASLEWATLSEIENDRFEIERAMDGINFSYVDQVQGAGNSSQEIAYDYTDKGAGHLAEKVYYRLKQVDFNGEFSYSEVRLVNFSEVGLQEKLFPNPVQIGESVIVQYKGIQTIKVFNSLGVLFFESHELNQALSTSIDTSEMSSGVYFVEVNGKKIHKLIVY